MRFNQQEHGHEAWVHQGMQGLCTTPRRLGGNILYLDFDGVLHHEDVYWNKKRCQHYFGSKATDGGLTPRLFEHSNLLIEALKPYPAVRIVLSTSWAWKHGYQKAKVWLPSALKMRCVGATFHSQMHSEIFRETSRGLQVLSDIARRRPVNWLAVDDDTRGWPEQSRDHVVVSDEAMGISHPRVYEDLTTKLEMTFGPRLNVVFKGMRLGGSGRN